MSAQLLTFAVAVLLATACLPHLASAFEPSLYPESEVRAIKMIEALRWDPSLNVTYSSTSSANEVATTVEVRVSLCLPGGTKCHPKPGAAKKRAAALATLLKSYGNGKFPDDVLPSRLSTIVYCGGEAVPPGSLPTKGPSALALAVNALRGNKLFKAGEAGDPNLGFNSWHIIFRARALQYRAGYDGGQAEAPYYAHTTVLTNDLLSKVYGLDSFTLESGGLLSFHADCDVRTGCDC